MKEQHRPFTKLGWLLSVLCLPTGMFFGLASARVISWTKAFAWFVPLMALQICFARGMAFLEDKDAPKLVIQMFLNSGLMLLGLSFLLIHYFGAREDYWSEKDRKAWRTLGWIGCFLALLTLTSLMVQLVVIPLWL
jgi:hypothetical protein